LRVRFEDYFDRWIDTYAGRTQRGFSETTRPEYRRPIEQHVLGRWGPWPLGDLEPGDVRDLFAERRAEGASTASIRKLRAALSVLFESAVEDGYLRFNPARGVRIPPAPDTEPEAERKSLTRAELGLLLGAIPQRWRLLFEVLAHSGLRIGELTGLTWEHVDLGTRPRLLVREQVYRGLRKRLKSKHSKRELPLSPRLAERLREHRRDTFRGDKTPVFCSSRGTPLNPSNLASRVLKPAARSVGLGWVSFHVFRKTCGSLLNEAGRNPVQVQGWLGHHAASFTLDTYVRRMDDGLGDADFLDDAVAVIEPEAVQADATAR
jgi:integrase